LVDENVIIPLYLEEKAFQNGKLFCFVIFLTNIKRISNQGFFLKMDSCTLTDLFALHLNVLTFVKNILTRSIEKWLNAYF
jgi:hypothetical protein